MNIPMLVLLVAAAIVAVVLVLAAKKPETFAVRRSALVHAPAEAIFPLINDLRAHEAWSPFDTPDANTRKAYSGAEAGRGAVYDWEGSSRSGSGTIAITESVAPSRIEMRLQMRKPMQADNQVRFELVPRDGATEVSWAMQGPASFAARIVHVFMDMDRVCGGAFEQGLANLKRLSERPAA